MVSAVLMAFLVLQAFSMCWTSQVLNGAMGDSIELPTDEKGPIQGTGFMQWTKNNIVVITLLKKESRFEIRATSESFAGRMTINNETGALRISFLKAEDFGVYVFSGLVIRSLKAIMTELRIYERIVSVEVTQVINSTDNRSCVVNLSCSVTGGSQVALSWRRNGENITGWENRSTLTISTREGEVFTCTATNPIGSLNETVTAGHCRPPGSLYICIAAGAGTILVVTVGVIIRAILKKTKRGEAPEVTTVYAEVGNNVDTQKGTAAAPTTVYEELKLDQLTSGQYQVLF